MLTGWHILREDKALLSKVVLIYLVMMFSQSGRYWIAFGALSQNAAFSDCVLFAAASILTQLVSTTPGGLGVREGIVAAVAATQGFAPDIAIVAVGLDRLIATTVVIIVGTVSSYLLSRNVLVETPARQLIAEENVEAGSAFERPD